MAQLERGTAYAKAPRPGQAARNIGRGVLDLATSPLGAIGLDYDPTYEGVNAGKWDKFSQISDSVGAAAGGMALSVATMGLGDKIGGVAGKVVGGALGDIGGDSQQPDLSGTFTAKYGGKLYYKKGKRFMKWGGEIPPTRIPPNQAQIDAALIKANASKPKQAVRTVSGSMRALPNGDWASYDDLKEPPPPTPEQIAQVVAEAEAQRLVQEGITPLNPLKKYGGSVFNTAVNPTMQWKHGGELLTSYNGNTHENGGIAISPTDEVEDKETSMNTKDGNKYIFSNSIEVPYKKNTTFAQASKRIESKYSKRLKGGDDKLATTAMNRELDSLSQQQEMVKEAMKTPEERAQEQMQLQQQQQMAMQQTQQPTQQPQQQMGDGGYINAENNSMAGYMNEYAFGGKYNPDPADKALFVNDFGYGGAIVPSTNDGYVPTSTNGYDEGGYLNTMFDEGGKYKFTPPSNYNWDRLDEDIPKGGLKAGDYLEMPQGNDVRSKSMMDWNKLKTSGSIRDRFLKQNPDSEFVKQYPNYDWANEYNPGGGINSMRNWENSQYPIDGNAKTLNDPKNEIKLGQSINPLGAFGQPRFNTNVQAPILKGRGYNFQSTPLKTLQRGTTPAYKQSMVEATTKANPSTSGYKPAYGIPMAGYAMQALSNLPALFAKPAEVNYDRVKPEMIDLSAQRDEARRGRNLQYAMAQRNAGQMDNAGQAGAYANAALSNISGAYGDAFNQSVMAQNTTNTGYKNTANAQNAQIQMAEQNARQQEADAIRSGKQQAIANMGSSLAQAGKTYGQMGQEANMMDWLNISNPDYGIKSEQRDNPLAQWFYGNKSDTPYKKPTKKYGGKVGRKV